VLVRDGSVEADGLLPKIKRYFGLAQESVVGSAMNVQNVLFCFPKGRG